MITGFGKYLIDNGFKRYRYEWVGHGKEKRQIEVEDYENENVSTYGPLQYCYKRGHVWCYWGLNIKGHYPKFFIVSTTGKPEDDYFDTSDYDTALAFLIEHSKRIKVINENAEASIKRFIDLKRRDLKP